MSVLQLALSSYVAAAFILLRGFQASMQYKPTKHVQTESRVVLAFEFLFTVLSSRNSNGLFYERF